VREGATRPGARPCGEKGLAHGSLPQVWRRLELFWPVSELANFASAATALEKYAHLGLDELAVITGALGIRGAILFLTFNFHVRLAVATLSFHVGLALVT